MRLRWSDSLVFGSLIGAWLSMSFEFTPSLFSILIVKGVFSQEKNQDRYQCHFPPSLTSKPSSLFPDEKTNFILFIFGIGCLSCLG